MTDVEIATKYTYAGFWLRFVATIIDLIIVSVVSAFIGAIIAGGDETGTVSALLNLFGDWLYCALMESSKFQGTVGKLVLGLIVTDDQYRPISFGRATWRYLGHILSTIILGIGFLMAAFTTRKQCLHDIMAGTLVVKKPSGYVRA
ncbi:MAG: RDD family protein [Chloroflexi bacterium]|nr:RDD family protein [Chloroflexota bacterium]